VGRRPRRCEIGCWWKELEKEYVSSISGLKWCVGRTFIIVVPHLAGVESCSLLFDNRTLTIYSDGMSLLKYDGWSHGIFELGLRTVAVLSFCDVDWRVEIVSLRLLLVDCAVYKVISSRVKDFDSEIVVLVVVVVMVRLLPDADFSVGVAGLVVLVLEDDLAVVVVVVSVQMGKVRKIGF
jgi:hypothetical protein